MGENYIKYGYIRGGDRLLKDVVWKASQVVKARSGRFVINDAGAIAIAGDGANEIIGHADEAEGTPATGAPARVNNDLTAIFRVPVMAGTYVKAMDGKTCDIKVTSNVQGADLTAATDNVLIVVGGDLVNNEYVDVRINPKEISQAGVV
jgi:hypothetical protein